MKRNERKCTKCDCEPSLALSYIYHSVDEHSGNISTGNHVCNRTFPFRNKTCQSFETGKPMFITDPLPFVIGAIVGKVCSKLKHCASGLTWSSAKESQSISRSIATDSLSLWAQRAVNSRHILLQGNAGKEREPHSGTA